MSGLQDNYYPGDYKYVLVMVLNPLHSQRIPKQSISITWEDPGQGTRTFSTMIRYIHVDTDGSTREFTFPFSNNFATTTPPCQDTPSDPKYAKYGRVCYRGYNDMPWMIAFDFNGPNFMNSKSAPSIRVEGIPGLQSGALISWTTGEAILIGSNGLLLMSEPNSATTYAQYERSISGRGRELEDDCSDSSCTNRTDAGSFRFFVGGSPANGQYINHDETHDYYWYNRLSFQNKNPSPMSNVASFSLDHTNLPDVPSSTQIRVDWVIVMSPFEANQRFWKLNATTFNIMTDYQDFKGNVLAEYQGSS
ncbi:hypothetical protein SAMD00019534_007490 [Acytostelium subglobosum LB1]|uniref:hypothetical protein n=1 Tax=Acytostelium subglobosum LB1 TaxID=1410327 RepID=UPI000644A734|nr:hypothetical protein SAMD00019534_007490 [Acytostelium subglobosum LB1]GAM17574.1 hypothetical protein SAMD00019534_007490 [Acytostelium subglobosum LB1]|eukprot:XP_012759636.1 hypothetical protein SAMD00019534_007490 [Acytostelium subglobosum LB1]